MVSIALHSALTGWCAEPDFFRKDHSRADEGELGSDHVKLSHVGLLAVDRDGLPVSCRVESSDLLQRDFPLILVLLVPRQRVVDGAQVPQECLKKPNGFIT